MKFKELPEGHYFIHAVRDTVYVQRLENPETAPRYVLELDTTKVVHDGRQYRKNGALLDDLEVEFKTYEDMRKERKSRGASYSHVTRRLRAKEPLKGKTLELALSLVGDGERGDELMNGIAKKLNAGQPLTDYELHIMVDMVLPHGRLG